MPAPCPDTVPEPTGAGRCALPFALSLSKPVLRPHEGGPPSPPAPACPALPPPPFPRKRESRAGARRRGVSASPTSHTRHRRTGESRYPKVRRAAARPHQPTSQARFEPSPFALSLSKPVLRALEGGPPPPPAPACPAHSHRRSRESGKVDSHLKCNTWSWKTSAEVR